MATDPTNDRSTDRREWTPERFDRLVRGMYLEIFGRPAPENGKVIDFPHHRPTPPCNDR
jgi:hypothetical protein